MKKDKIRKAAGIIIISKEDERVLLLERSEKVNDPGYLCNAGGSSARINGSYEPSIQTALRESIEEMKELPKGRLSNQPIIYSNPRIIYETFILNVRENDLNRFKPILNWEHNSYDWIKFEDLDKIRKYLHPGTKFVLDNILEDLGGSKK